jgi:hypothetical protein
VGGELRTKKWNIDKKFETAKKIADLRNGREMKKGDSSEAGEG